ncbi:hypothetical protein AB4099_28185 [Bosea sp. 2KB_26]|uniref:hypothetical protein n=1 Tax=Bosea sp. 2KB_26 TaxID=3237475 RepID=UPI003F8FFCA8
MNSSMLSSLANFVLFAALVLTSVLVTGMYRKLKGFEAMYKSYGTALEASSAALSQAHAALTGLNAEANGTLASLGDRIEEAKELIAELDRRKAS